MRVVFAHDHIFYRFGEAIYSSGRLPYSAWNRYLEHFDEVVVVARFADVTDEITIKDMQRSDGPRVSFVGLPPVRGVRRIFGVTGAQQRGLRDMIRNSDAIVARVPSEIGLKVAGLGHHLGIPVACEVVASAWHSLWYHGGILPKLYAPLFELRTKMCLVHSNFALYVTQSYLQRKYPCKGVSEVASNVTVHVSDDALERRLRRINRRAPTVIGFVGSLHASYKGLDVAIHALAQIKKAHPDIRLQIVGDGPIERWKRRTNLAGIGSNVEFLGALAGSLAVQSWLDEVDVYIHPSRAEGLPRSLIEAMSRGCLAFGSRVGGIPELLADAYMHAPRDAKRLASLIVQAMSTDERRRAARVNIEASRAFDQSLLDARRSQFFSELARVARSRVAARFHPEN